MDKRSFFNKAILLLDRGRDVEAIQILNEMLQQSVSENDFIYSIRTANLLGEYYYKIGDKKAAETFLQIVTENKNKDEDLIDIVGKEIDNAESILAKLQE